MGFDKKKKRGEKEKPGPTLVVGEHTVQLGRKLGEGANAVVWKGTLSPHGQAVAVKRILLPPRGEGGEGPETVSEREMHSLASESVHCCRLLSSSMLEVDGASDTAGCFECVLLMEYCGPSLFSRMEQQGALSPPEILCFSRDMALALKFLASHDIAHRDLKVENILSVENASAYKLCDFGSAARMPMPLGSAEERSAVEQELAERTTLIYRAPEMVDLFLSPILDTQTDVWALGCCIVYAATLEHPFKESGAAGILNEAFEPALEDAQLQRLAAACLQYQPSMRARPQAVVDMCSHENADDGVAIALAPSLPPAEKEEARDGAIDESSPDDDDIQTEPVHVSNLQSVPEVEVFSMPAAASAHQSDVPMSNLSDANEDLRSALEHLDLVRYYERLFAYGVENTSDLAKLKQDDFESMEIKPLHARRLTEFASGDSTTVAAGPKKRAKKAAEQERYERGYEKDMILDVANPVVEKSLIGTTTAVLVLFAAVFFATVAYYCHAYVSIESVFQTGVPASAAAPIMAKGLTVIQISNYIYIAAIWCLMLGPAALLLSQIPILNVSWTPIFFYVFSGASILVFAATMSQALGVSYFTTLQLTNPVYPELPVLLAFCSFAIFLVVCEIVFVSAVAERIDPDSNTVQIFSYIFFIAHVVAVLAFLVTQSYFLSRPIALVGSGPDQAMFDTLSRACYGIGLILTMVPLSLPPYYMTCLLVEDFAKKTIKVAFFVCWAACFVIISMYLVFVFATAGINGSVLGTFSSQPFLLLCTIFCGICVGIFVFHLVMQARYIHTQRGQKAN